MFCSASNVVRTSFRLSEALCWLTDKPGSYLVAITLAECKLSQYDFHSSRNLLHKGSWF